MLARAGLGAALGCITLLMAGCVEPVERDDARMVTSPEQVRTAPTQPAVRPQQEAAVEKKRKSNVTTNQPVADPATANPPVETSLEPEGATPATEQPVYTASELMGKKPAEVTELMGAPARVEQRAASTVWIYQDGDCGLDVFFFLDVATSDERVLTVAPTAESEAAANAASAAAAANAAAAVAPAAGAAETPPPATTDTTQSTSTGTTTGTTTGASATGAPTAGASATAAGTDATQTASPPPAGNIVDVCYGKLRRS